MDPSSRPADVDALARALVEQILQAGMWLADVISELVEGLPDDAFPGERPVEVVLEMVAGTVAPAVREAGPVATVRAIELIARARDRTLEDLRAAGDIARRRDAA